METIYSKDVDIWRGIDALNEAVICEYFIRLNNREFKEAAELFGETGCLKPPFDKPVDGRKAIAEYFDKEARGMILCPEYGKLLKSDSLNRQYQIQGKVKTSLFTVNVGWLIELNEDKEIMLVEVKLLASLEELLSFKPS